MFFRVRLKEGLNEVMCLVLITHKFKCLLLNLPFFKCLLFLEKIMLSV